MTDNRLPLLLEAAMEGLIAITDVGVEKNQDRIGGIDVEGLAYLLDRNEQTGMGLEERLKAAHGKLQAALKLFARELEMEEN